MPVRDNRKVFGRHGDSSRNRHGQYRSASCASPLDGCDAGRYGACLDAAKPVGVLTLAMRVALGANASAR